MQSAGAAGPAHAGDWLSEFNFHEPPWRALLHSSHNDGQEGVAAFKGKRAAACQLGW